MNAVCEVGKLSVMIGRELPIDTAARRLYAFAADLRAPVVGAIHVAHFPIAKSFEAHSNSTGPTAWETTPRDFERRSTVGNCAWSVTERPERDQIS